MLLLLVMNAVGILCGFLQWTSIMYFILGIAWISFSREYSKITWKIYEKLIENEEIDTVIDVRLTNILSVVFLMIMVYSLLYMNARELCAVLSILQYFGFQLLYTRKAYSEKNMLLLVGSVIELVLLLFLL